MKTQNVIPLSPLSTDIFILTTTGKKCRQFRLNFGLKQFLTVIRRSEVSIVSPHKSKMFKVLI